MGAERNGCVNMRASMCACDLPDRTGASRVIWKGYRDVPVVLMGLKTKACAASNTAGTCRWENKEKKKKREEEN